ncbi:unnamed protein product [Cuscuta campestris]|uniref:Uncharacterized protein n=1 Tax=Cuscuta campestris TaxID=132261 RepID=A0A484NTD2_9ASTE|nr:unnamed protein product [Cuscuta campestris]
MHRDTKSLLHINILNSGRQPPIKPVQKIRKRQLHQRHRKVYAGTAPPSHSERYQLEMRAFEVNAAVLEPLRPKLGGVLPRPRVPPDGHGIDEDARLLRDIVPADRAIAGGFPGHEQRRRRVESEGLFEHHFQVVQIGKINLADSLFSLEELPHF